MSFCENYETLDEAIKNYPSKKCENCEKNKYKQGTMTCENMTNIVDKED